MRALPGERQVLKDNGTPDPAKPTGMLGTRVISAVGALVRPCTEHRPLPLLQDFFKFQGAGSDSWGRLNLSSLSKGAQGQGTMGGDGPSKGNTRHHFQHPEPSGAIAAIQVP